MSKIMEIIVGGAIGGAAAGIGFAGVHEALYSSRDPSVPQEERYKTPHSVAAIAAGGAVLGALAEKYSPQSAVKFAVSVLAVSTAAKLARANGLIEAR